MAFGRVLIGLVVALSCQHTSSCLLPSERVLTLLFFLVVFRKLPAFKLQFLFQCHNLFLSTGSALLLILMAQEM